MNKKVASVAARVRQPRPRGGRIRSRLTLIMVIPLVAVVVLTGIALVDAGRQAVAAGHVESVAKLNIAVSGLVYQLEKERVVAAASLATKDDVAKAAFQAQWDDTNNAVTSYQDLRGSVRGVSSSLDRQLTRLDREVHGLTALRGDVVGGKVTTSAATFHYQVFIGDLLAVRDNASQAAGASGQLADEIRAASTVSQAKENASEEQAFVLSAIASPTGFDPADYRDFLVTLVGQQSAMQSFAVVASPAEQNAFDNAVQGSQVRESRLLETQVEQLGPNTPIDIQPDQWTQAMTARVAAERAVEQKLDDQVLSLAQNQLDQVERSALVESAVVAAVLVAAVLLALLIARAMAGALRRLRTGALHVAYEALPGSVARLRNPETAGRLHPDDVVAQVGDAIKVRGPEEIGQVAQAFNAVHREAVRVAAEQAVLRASVASMFINLARRSQALVDKLIGQLDLLERDEEDPDRLAMLFQLDHLVTRMRRNDDSLLVLAGSETSRVRRDTAELGDVLRAALGEVEQYTRIDFGRVDQDVLVRAEAVNDMVHLVAELLDNATSFSAPESAVNVEGCRLGDRAVIYIEDHGIGMAPEALAEMNERLANPPTVDAAMSRMMGLMVVAQLAARLRVQVTLRPVEPRGTAVDILIPADLLLPRTSGSRAAQASRDRQRPADRTGAGHPPQRPAALPAAMTPPPAPTGPATLASGLPARAPGATSRGAGPSSSSGSGFVPGSGSGSGSIAASAWAPPPGAVGEPRTPGAARTQEGATSEVDATAEMPIFRSVESGWFPRGRGGQSGGEGASQGNLWQTPADEGWQRAQAVARRRDYEVGDSGLPRRQPQAHLVPGGVRGAGNPLRAAGELRRSAGNPSPEPGPRHDEIERSPERVRGLLSAYQRGVQRGRSEQQSR